MSTDKNRTNRAECLASMPPVKLGDWRQHDLHRLFGGMPVVTRDELLGRRTDRPPLSGAAKSLRERVGRLARAEQALRYASEDVLLAAEELKESEKVEIEALEHLRAERAAAHHIPTQHRAALVLAMAADLYPHRATDEQWEQLVAAGRRLKDNPAALRVAASLAADGWDGSMVELADTALALEPGDCAHPEGADGPAHDQDTDHDPTPGGHRGPAGR